jgi:putative ABC transport system permease protein
LQLTGAFNVVIQHRPHQVSPLEIGEMAIEALWNNKLRSGLTMLGVIIGIASVIAISSIGEGVTKSTEDTIRGLGTDVLQVMAGSAESGGISQAQGSVSTLTWEDAKAIYKAIPKSSMARKIRQRRCMAQIYTIQRRAISFRKPGDFLIRRS